MSKKSSAKPEAHRTVREEDFSLAADELIGDVEESSVVAEPADAQKKNDCVWDFRHGDIPSGVDIVGDKAACVLCSQQDGSTALSVPAGTELKMDLSGSTATAAGFGRKYINDYTLTMDVWFPQLPSDSLSLFQAGGGDPSKHSEGDAFLYNGGGVGVFGEVGVAESVLQPGKWTRIVVTLGGAAASGASDNVGFSLNRHSVDDDSEDDEYQPRRALQGSSMNTRRSYTSSSASSLRYFTTYINSKKCASITSASRGVVGVADGRLCVNPEAFSLFGSSSPSKQTGGFLVKYAALVCGVAMKESEIKAEAQKNRIFSSWEKDRLAAREAMRRQLTLQSLYKAPPPIWIHPAVVAEFGDAFIEGGGVDGGDICSAASVLTLVLEELLSNVNTSESSVEPIDSCKLLSNFSHEVAQSMNYLCVTLKTLRLLARPYSMALKNGAAQLVHYLKTLRKQVCALSEGNSVFIPGGIGPASPVLFILEKEADEMYRFTIVNTDPYTGLDYHLSTAESASKIKFQTIVTLPHISKEKIEDDGFWGLLMKLAILPSKHNTSDKLYDIFLPFLAGKPLDQIMFESYQSLELSTESCHEPDEESTEPSSALWSSPQRSSTAFYRCLMEATVYILHHRRQVPLHICSTIFLSIRIQYILFMERDLGFVHTLHDSDRRTIALACSQLAYRAVKVSKRYGTSPEVVSNADTSTGMDIADSSPGALALNDLRFIYQLVENVQVAAYALPCVDADMSAVPPLLIFDHPSRVSHDPSAKFSPMRSINDCNRQYYPHLLSDRLMRVDDVNGLAGAPIQLPRYVPVDFLQLPSVIEDFEDIVAAIRLCDRLCTLVAVQGHCVKNQELHIVSVVQNVFTQLLPMAKPNFYPASACVWRKDIRYGLQLDLTICLGRILEHFIASVYSLHATKSLDALKLIIPAAIAVFADVILRKKATDQPSEFCMHLMNGGRTGFGLALANFGAQTETIEMHTPELNIARTAILDYFEAQKSVQKMFNWDVNHGLEEETCTFLSGLCEELAFPRSEKAFIGYIMQSNALVNKNYPEFHVYRDIAFYMKYVQNVDPRVIPPKNNYTQMSAELKWDFQQGAFAISAFMRGFELRCYPEKPFTGAHRYPSAASPTYLASPHEIKTEDDVLHIKNLPSFGDCMGQQDVELLLSYLTVPYVRVPLVLSLFATEDRIHSLRSVQLQDVLDAVLFEPSIYLVSAGTPDEHADEDPTEVPCTNKKLLATPYGLLLNELYNSPDMIVNCSMQLMQLAAGLDVGSVHSSTLPIILFILRLLSRVESYITYLLICDGLMDGVAFDENSKDKSFPCKSHYLRGIKMKEKSDVYAKLLAGRDKIRQMLYAQVHPLLESWCVELMLESENVKDKVSTKGVAEDVVRTNATPVTSAEAGKIFDKNTVLACQIHAHILILFRNTFPSEMNYAVASTLLSSMSFLTTRHTWNMNLLGVPEHELFELLMVQKRRVVLWTRNRKQQELNVLLESIVRVSVGTGIRAESALADSNAVVSSGQSATSRTWSFIQGSRSVGRFTVSATNRRHQLQNEFEPISEVDSAKETAIEMDFQLAQITLRSSHLQALETEIAEDADVKLIFGSKSMQASIVEMTEHRTWVHLVGRGHDVEYWKTPDSRPCIQELDRDYAPGEVFPSEEWIVPLLEPVRLTYMTQPFVLQICMQEKPLSADAQVAYLVGIHPKAGGTWKEIFIFRTLGVVQVYNVLSHGRRFYRVLEYTSDVRYSLREMQPSLKDRQQPWPAWERYGSESHPYDDHWGNPLSSVISRGWDYPENLSGGKETYLPPRLLFGVVPQALLDVYHFWQTEDDGIFGYPRDAATDPQRTSVVTEAVDDVAADSNDNEESTSHVSVHNNPYLLSVRLHHPADGTGNNMDTCASIERLMRVDVENRLKIQMDIVHCMDSSGLINGQDDVTDTKDENDPISVTFKLFARVSTLVKMLEKHFQLSQCDVPVETCIMEAVVEFIDALKMSGAVYECVADLCTELESFVGAMCTDDASPVIKEASLDQVDLVLINMLGTNCASNSDGKLLSLLKCLTRMENIGHILCWTRKRPCTNGDSTASPPVTVHLVEFPRLKMSFEERKDDQNISRLYSLDHMNLYISNDHTGMVDSNPTSAAALARKLMAGIPHALLMSTCNNEYHVLVPTLDVVRPKIASNPFTTELVMNRNKNPKWYADLGTTCYNLYAVHVSMSFLFSSTLAAGLYLLLLRFLNRSYEETFRLADTIGTDTAFTSEEANIFTVLGRVNSDCHPNAHACRLKITLVCLDAPGNVYPWDLTRQMSRYVTKLSHVSVTCRLSHAEELHLLRLCVCDESDSRFFDVETGKPLYTLYEVTVVKNRKYYLTALIDEGSILAETFLIPRPIGTRWTAESNKYALMVDPTSSYLELEVQYTPPPALSGHAVYQTTDVYWPGSEEFSGMGPGHLGFLFLYELLTGTKRAKFMEQNISITLAMLCYELTAAKSQDSIFSSILSLLCRFPHLREVLPKYSDTRQMKTPTIKAMGDDTNPISPLGTLLHKCLAVLHEQLAVLTMASSVSIWTDSPTEPASYCCVIPIAEGDREWIIPQITDYSCSSRHLMPVSAGTMNGFEVPKPLAILENELNMFSSMPLSAIDLSSFVTYKTRAEYGKSKIPSDLPFDVSPHSQSKSVVALSMIARLRTDVKEYASSQNLGTTPHLSFLWDLIAQRDSKVANEESLLDTAVEQLELLIQNLKTLRDADETYLFHALGWLHGAVNNVEGLPKIDGQESAENFSADSQVLFLLKRKCDLEVNVWLEFLFGSTLSSVQTADLQRLNHFLSQTQIEMISYVIIASILHASRIGQINRCLADTLDLLKVLQKLVGSVRNGHATSIYDSSLSVAVSSLVLKSESLATNLVVGRHFIDKVGVDSTPLPPRSPCVSGGEEKRQRLMAADELVGQNSSAPLNSFQLVYDPRFLLFEFTWNILLRKSQVTMVRDYMKTIKEGGSSVKQMIMGAGKTTVVCPLLTLLLGDGKNLVIQVVPPALLEFSRSVMRSTFSSIMHKRIFTLSFDRSTEVTPTIMKKLLSSISQRGVVMSTPTSIKSIMLKFLETADMIRDTSQRHSLALENDCQELGKILNLFKDSILIMDEVDLILHPLKSELNFPIGIRQDLDAAPRRWQLPIHLMDAIFFTEQHESGGQLPAGFRESHRASAILKRFLVVINKGYEMRALQRNPHLVLLNVDWYHTKMKPLLAEWVFLWLEAQHLLAGSKQSDVINYITIDVSEVKSAVNNEVVLLNMMPEQRKLVNLCRNWLNSYLPHILQKIDRVSFGIMNSGDYDRAIAMDPYMPRTRAKLAIPFVGKDVPSRSSEFAHPDVILGLTVLGYRYEGLRWSDFEDIISHLRSALTKEIGPWHQRKSSLRFEEWIKDAGGIIKGSNVKATTDAPMDVVLAGDGEKVKVEVMSLRLLKRSNEKQMTKIFNLIRLLPECIHFYLDNFIFPVHMDNKIMKLSAAGQELGGDMMFKRRIGFSGTPSDLLPVELGRCGYEKCSDGQMLHVMTSPAVCSYEVVGEKWSPMSILSMIANPNFENDSVEFNASLKSSVNDERRYHALIDSGALITGMTNLEVAKQLLQLGLDWCEGVVFLDDFDRKMILVRATGRVLKMAQCGIPAEKRFAFYDQVHTTGMDIGHVIHATAVLTLSKDMVFRDFAQGAYRMRGINRGQRIHIIVIPEVKDLICRELGKCSTQLGVVSDGMIPQFWQPTQSPSLANRTADEVRDHVRQILRAINAWLVINSMRSERIQYNLLCLQNTSNVWRKLAFATLLKRQHEFTIKNYLDGGDVMELVDRSLMDNLDIFCEHIDFVLEEGLPIPVSLKDSIMQKVNQHRTLLPMPAEHEQKFINDINDWMLGKTLIGDVDTAECNVTNDLKELSDVGFGEDVGMDVFLSGEMVQEQEQEKEQQQEQEQEQEIEIEKYVDLAYSREHEEPVPWPFSSLQTLNYNDLPQFYRANQFKLFMRKSLALPEHVFISNNYFDKRWSGARRIKNVVMMLECTPKPRSIIPKVISNAPLTALQEATLDSAISLFVSGGMQEREVACSAGNLDDIRKIINAACHLKFNSNDDLLSYLSMMDTHVPVSTPGSDGNHIDYVKELIIGGTLNRIQEGRFFIMLSLAEAETIRRILHIHSGNGSCVLPGTDLAIALRCVAAENMILDRCTTFHESMITADDNRLLAPPSTFGIYHCPFMTTSAYEVARFFNCDMFFNDKSINVLLRSLFTTSKRDRRAFFKHVLSCRRRLTKKWTESPVAKLFLLVDQYSMLKQRALSMRILETISEKQMLLYDAFVKFDYDRNGFLCPSEVWGGLDYLGFTSLEAQDILDFVAAADKDHDGNVSYQEFIDMLCGDEEFVAVLESSDTMNAVDAHPPTALARSSSFGTMLSRAVSVNSDHSASADDDSLKPIPMQRQISRGISGAVVLPKGAEELEALKNLNKLEEEAEEKLGDQLDTDEESRIRMTIEAEEEMRDAAQAGGVNPSMQDDMLWFNFRTGRLPRKVTSRGDCKYLIEHGGSEEQKYLKVFHQASLFLPCPFDANCGGRGLNQYTVTLEFMLESLPKGPERSVPKNDKFNVNSHSSFGTSIGEETTRYDAFHDYGSLSSSTASNVAMPIFSVAGFGETEATVWINSQGMVDIHSAGMDCVHSSSACPARVQAGRWTCLTIVVDCVEGEICVFLDDTKVIQHQQLTAGGINIDGISYSIQEKQLTLFGTKNLSLCLGGCLRTVVMFPRCLVAVEVAEVVGRISKESEAGWVDVISTQLVSMGFSSDIAAWAAKTSLSSSSSRASSTLEERVNAAFTILTADNSYN